MQYTSFIDNREQQLRYAMNAYWDEGRWVLEEYGEKGMLMLYALTDNANKFEEYLRKMQEDLIDADD